MSAFECFTFRDLFLLQFDVARKPSRHLFQLHQQQLRNDMCLVQDHGAPQTERGRPLAGRNLREVPERTVKQLVAGQLEFH
jgi:hypothetical protein